MRKLLLYIGFDKSLEAKNKFTYIINGVSILLVLLYLSFFIVLVKSFLVNLVSILCLIVLLSVFILLKKKRYGAAKLLLVFGFLMQECALVFLWFPVEANINYFFFIVAPISFFIYDFEIREDKISIIAVNILAAFLLLASEVFLFSNPLVQLSGNMIKLFSSLSIISTMGSIFIVYYFYAWNLSKNRKELNHLAETDSLTGVYNRRTLYREGEALFSYCTKNKCNFSFIILDIDHFKKVNDQYGHPVGDELLKQLTNLISENIRHSDIFTRYGGEEFALILKDISEESNLELARNLKSLVEKNDFVISEELSIHITISIGVSTYSNTQKDFDDIVILADNALYEAKERGRNRVVVSKTIRK